MSFIIEGPRGGPARNQGGFGGMDYGSSGGLAQGGYGDFGGRQRQAPPQDRFGGPQGVSVQA